MDGRAGGAPWTRIFPRRATPTPEAVAFAAEALARARRPLLIAGILPRPWETGPALRRAAAALELPLLADALSGARFPEEGEGGGPAGNPGPNAREAPIIGGYDLALRDPGIREALRPDLVIRVGAAPTSALLVAWLTGLDETVHLLVDGGGRWKDHAGSATCMIPADPERFLSSLLGTAAPGGERDPSWARSWARVEAAVGQDLRARVGAPLFEGTIMAEVGRALGGSDLLFVSSSMPVRDLDTFVPWSEGPLLALANRGASGIDGIVSTAAGASLATGRRVVAVVGDLALLHDANGLATLRDPDVRVILVVVNNDGGGIFHLLPIREHEPAFTPLFATPHGRTFEALAGMHALPYRRVEGRSAAAGPDAVAGLRAALGETLGLEGSGILEIRTDREENRRRRMEVAEGVAAAASGALTGEDG